MPRPGKEPHELNSIKCIKETEQAILVVVDGEELWVPKSVIHEESEVQGMGDEGSLTVDTWFAEEKELE